MTPRIGLWGARADSRGLAAQMRGFADHLKPTKVMGIDMTADDLSPYPCNWRAYEGHDLSTVAYSALNERIIRRWLKGLDVVLGAETFYRDEFADIARQMGVATVLQVNPEFARYWRWPQLPRPDVFIAPTTWRME